jgi:hypothetical protein
MNGRAGPVAWDRGLPLIPFSVLVNANGVDLAESHLTTAVAPAIGGVAGIDATFESDGAALQANGNLTVAKLKLARQGTPADEPFQFRFALQEDLRTHTGVLSRCDAQLQKGSTSMTGRFSTIDGRLSVKLTVTTQGAPVTPLATLLPALGLPLPFGSSLQNGLAFVDLEVSGPIDHPTATGKVTLDNAKLVNFNLEDRLGSVTGMDVLHFGNDLAISHLTADVNIGLEKTELSNIETLLPELGTITGSGTIANDRTLDFKLAVVRSGIAEKKPIPVLVRGAATSPVFR